MQEGTSIPPLETTQEIVEEQAPVSEEAIEDNNNEDNTPSF
jgi:hypothetical protein